MSAGCVVRRCQNKNLIERLTSGCEWRHASEARARRIWGILKKSVELRPASEEDGWLSLARRSQVSGLWRVPHEMGGGRWKSQNRKNVYLSPYVEEPLNSKVIKSFVPELRSRYVFFEFRDSYVLCIYIYMNIIWLWYSYWINNNTYKVQKQNME